MAARNLKVGQKVTYRRTGERAWHTGRVWGFYRATVYINSMDEGIVAVFPFMIRGTK